MNIIRKILVNKVLFILSIILILSFISGLLFPAFLSNSNKELIAKSLNNFFVSISKNNLKYLDAITMSFITNGLTTILIWILGISIIGFIIIIMILCIKSFIVGFSFSSILTIYGFKGLLLDIIYIIPSIISLIIFFILSYYAICFSIMLFKYYFKNKKYNRGVIVRRYVKVLVFSFVGVILNSFIEVFLVPSILKIFI